MGCSWACGEWVQGDNPHAGRVMHTGTRQYLEEAGHRVISAADPGSSNWAQLNRLEPHHPLQRPGSPSRLADIDVILWFWTDPLRDLINTQFLGQDLTGFDLVGEHHQPRTMADYVAVQDHLSRATMAHMERLAQGRPVLIVGGVAPVPEWTRDLYPKWVVVVRDWVRWLVPDTKVSMAHNNRCWQYEDCDEEMLDFHERSEEGSFMFRWRAQHRTGSMEQRYWWPDGVHPNRLAHQRLTQELILPLL